MAFYNILPYFSMFLGGKPSCAISSVLEISRAIFELFFLMSLVYQNLWFSVNFVCYSLVHNCYVLSTPIHFLDENFTLHSNDLK